MQVSSWLLGMTSSINLQGDLQRSAVLCLIPRVCLQMLGENWGHYWATLEPPLQQKLMLKYNL